VAEKEIVNVKRPNYGLLGASEVWTLDLALDLASELMEWSKDPQNLWIGSFFTDREIPARIGPFLADKFPEFARAYEIAKDRQCGKLLNGSMHRELDGSTVRLVLSSSHGIHDRQTVEHTGAVPVQVVSYASTTIRDSMPLC
jgi:hypothetical protein